MESNPNIEPFQFPYSSAKRAFEFKKNGGHWDAQVHFTGGMSDPREIRFIEKLLTKYGKDVSAYCIFSPFPGTYSVELQFRDEEQGKLSMSACLDEYHSAFDEGGSLKQTVANEFRFDGPFKLIVVRPMMPAEVIGIQPKDFKTVVDQVVGENYWELVPYPRHFKQPLTMIVNEDGIHLPTPYNRWGIVGGFVVCRMDVNGNPRSMTQSQIDAAIEHLTNEKDGLLNPKSQLLCSFREPFAQYGTPPGGYVPPAGRWFA